MAQLDFLNHEGLEEHEEIHWLQRHSNIYHRALRVLRGFLIKFDHYPAFRQQWFP